MNYQIFLSRCLKFSIKKFQDYNFMQNKVKPILSKIKKVILRFHFTFKFVPSYDYVSTNIIQ